MGDKDITERRLESNNDVFADILNAWFTIAGSGHVGKVEPDDLQDTAARTMYKANSVLDSVEARGIAIGEERGEKRGEERGRLTVARRLVADGMSPEQAARIAEVPV